MNIKDEIISKLKQQIELCNKKMLEIESNHEYDTLDIVCEDYKKLLVPDIFRKTEELIKNECIDKDRRDQLIGDLSTINDVLKIMSISPEEEDKLRPDEVVRYKRICDFILEIKNNATSNSSEFKSLQTMCYSIIDKIEGYSSSKKMITADEVEFISDLFGNSELYGSVLDFIDKVVHSAYNNIIEHLQNGGTLEELEEISRDNKKKLERNDVYNILSRFFTDSSLINEIIDDFNELVLRRGDLNNISAIVDYLISSNEYAFLRDYGLKNKDKKDRKRKIGALSTLFTYSSVDILRLIEHDVSYVEINSPVKSLFDTVPGIYRKGKIKEGEPAVNRDAPGTGSGSNNVDGISGSFDTYLENKKTFTDLSTKWFGGLGIDVFEQIVKFKPSCLDIPSELLKKEIDIYELYQIEKKKTSNRVQSAGFISSSLNKYLESADRMIEAGDDCLKYLKDYPTAFRHDSSNLIVYTKKMYPNEIWFKPKFCQKIALERVEQEMEEEKKKKVEEKKDENSSTTDAVTNFIDKKYRISVNNFISEKIKFADRIDLNDYTKSDDKDIDGVIDWLEANCLEDNQFTYKIGDILVSRFKFNRVYNILTSNVSFLRNNSKNDIILYALSYGSLLTSDEFELLRSFAYRFKFENEDTSNKQI